MKQLELVDLKGELDFQAYSTVMNSNHWKGAVQWHKPDFILDHVLNYFFKKMTTQRLSLNTHCYLQDGNYVY